MRFKPITALNVEESLAMLMLLDFLLTGRLKDEKSVKKFSRKHEGKRSLLKPRSNCEDNITKSSISTILPLLMDLLNSA
jgi:hypothetical protein